MLSPKSRGFQYLQPWLHHKAQLASISVTTGISRGEQHYPTTTLAELNLSIMLASQYCLWKKTLVRRSDQKILLLSTHYLLICPFTHNKPAMPAIKWFSTVALFLKLTWPISQVGPQPTDLEHKRIDSSYRRWDYWVKLFIILIINYPFSIINYQL